MYQLQYADIEEDAVVDARTRERLLMARSISLMETARDQSADAMLRIEATHFNRRLWTAFVNDLGQADNQLPKELRASLISIGIWILKESEKIRKHESDDFDGVIEITQTIMEGV